MTDSNVHISIKPDSFTYSSPANHIRVVNARTCGRISTSRTHALLCPSELKNLGETFANCANDEWVYYDERGYWHLLRVSWPAGSRANCQLEFGVDNEIRRTQILFLGPEEAVKLGEFCIAIAEKIQSDSADDFRLRRGVARQEKDWGRGPLANTT